MHTTKTRRTASIVAAIAAVLAICVHAYLANVHYEVELGGAAGDRICNVGEAFNCEAVSASRWSEFLGVPMAVWGLSVNAAFLLALAAWAFAEPERKKGRAAAALAISALILAASVVMGGISAFAMSKYCLFCMIAYAISIVSFAAAWFALSDDVRARARIGESGLFASALKPAALALAIAGAGAYLGNWNVLKSYGAQDLRPMVRSMIDEWLRAPATTIAPASALTMGASAESAKLTIVEFADFRCSHCRHAAPTLHAFASSSPDVRFIFQPWPLDGACNPKIPGANGASCELARLSFCATKLGEAQGKGQSIGWAAHKWMFDSQERFFAEGGVTNAVGDLAEAIGVDEAALKECDASNEAKDAVAKQSAVGDALDLPGTPSFYANGRKLNGGQLMPVLKEALARASEAAPPNRP